MNVSAQISSGICDTKDFTFAPSRGGELSPLGYDNRDATHVEDNFVEELHCVAQEHERHDVPIDLAAQRAQVDGINTLGIAVLVEELPRSIDVVDSSSGRQKAGGSSIVT